MYIYYIYYVYVYIFIYIYLYIYIYIYAWLEIRQNLRLSKDFESFCYGMNNNRKWQRKLMKY